MRRDKEEDSLGPPLKTRETNILGEFEGMVLGSERGMSPKTAASPASPKAVGGKENNCDSLLTPSGTPFTSLLDEEPQNNVTAQSATTEVCASKLELVNAQVEPTCGENYASPMQNDSKEGSCMPLSSDVQVSTTPKPDSPPEHHKVPPSAKSLSPVTPSFTDTSPSSKPMARTVTTTSAKTSAPNSRPRGQACKSASKSVTPTTRPSKLLTPSSMCVPPGRSCSAGKLGQKTTGNPVLSCGNSTGRSRPQNHTTTPDSTTDAPQNVTTSVGGGTHNPSGKPRQCSPLGKHGLNRSACSNARHQPAARRAYPDDGENVSPAQVGTNMVERVVNMRRLAPPKHDKHVTTNQQGKSHSQSSSGFGRTLSKNSLDMALRHMDIGQNIPGHLRPLVKKVPASSKSGVRSEMAQRSNASPELVSLDTREPDNNLGSERS